MSGRNWTIVVIALLLGILAVTLWRNSGQGVASQVVVQGAPSVVAEPVIRRTVEDYLDAIGTTASWESIEVRSSVTEIVSEIHAADGQLVKRGDLLISLDQREELAHLAEAQAFLAEQDRELRRIADLVARKSLPQNQLDERTTLREIARARVKAAQAAVADRTIFAPFSGMLGLRDISPGALVKPETLITTLDDIVTLRLDFAVPSLHLSALHVGSIAQATTPAFPGAQFKAAVSGIDSRVNPVDRAVLVRARIDNSAMQLRPGMLLNVRLHLASRDALVIPEEAIIHNQRNHYVLLVDAADGNRLIKRDIVIGVREPGSAEVLSGLKEGELVVTEGLTSARPGQQVRLRVSEAAKPVDIGTPL